MSKIQSRKFFAFAIWIVFMGTLVAFAKEHIGAAIPWFGGVTVFYVSTQAVIDGIVAWRAVKEEDK